jgi:hypothetical protein
MATPPKPRKPRGDSKLDALPPAQLAELVQGLLCGWTYTAALDWLAVECGVAVSLSSLTPFYSRHVEPILVERKQFAALSAKTLAKLAGESAAFDAAAIGELKEYAYRLIRDPNSNPEEARKWMATLIKAQAGTRDDRKLRLLEEAAREAKAKLTALASAAKSNGGLTAETLKQIEEAAGLL